MKTKLFSTALLVMLALNGWAQCGTDEIHEMRMKTDKLYKEQIISHEKKIQLILENKKLQKTAPSTFSTIYTIPVVVHVIHTGEAIGTGTNISDSQIQGAIQGLNDRFRNYIGNGLDIEIQFCLASQNPNGNSTNGINRVNGSGVPNYSSNGIYHITENPTGASEIAVKGLSSWPRSDYYNIWVVNSVGNIDGYANYPSIFGAVIDGAVLKASRFNNSDVAVAHEVAHGFNLYHTFEGDNDGIVCPADLLGLCTLFGDNVCDTPPHKRNDCGNTNPCSSDGIWDNSRYNYMSYCTVGQWNGRFTQDQKDRMRAQLLIVPRASLLNSQGCSGTPSCGIPGGLSATNITSSSATLNWTTVGAPLYRIRYKPTASTSWTIGTVANAPQTLFWLSASTQYEFQIQAICPSGIVGDYSGSSFFTTTAPCGIPSGLSVAYITSSSATLNWTNITPSYNVRYKPAAAATWTNITVSNPTAALSGLTYSTQYEFQVQSLCSSGGISNYSTTSLFTTTAFSCGIPSGLSATNVTAGSATLNWAAVSGATSYWPRYKPTSSSTWINVTFSTTANANIAGLYPATAYEFQVRAVCGGPNNIYSASSVFTTGSIATTCGTPSGLSSIPNAAGSAAAVSWIAVNGATSYTIRYKPTASGSWTTLNSTTTSKIISGLTVATSYEFQVQAICSVPGSYSVSAFFTTGGVAPCGTPSLFGVTNITSGSATLNWTAVNGAASYNVRYKPTASATWINSTSSTTPKIVTALTPSTPYEFQVQANCSTGGTSNYSASSFFTTAVPCQTPGGLAVINLTYNSVTLNWTHVNNVASYNIRYKPATSTIWTTINITNFFNPPIVSGLTASTPYEFQIQTLCSGGGASNYSASLICVTPAAPACGIPGGLSATNITFSSATLNWAAVSGATSYNVQYRSLSSSTWIITNTTNNAIALSGLAASTSYHFQVQAVCSVIDNYSEPVVFNTVSAPPCGIPGSLSATNITPNSATLNWGAVSGATSYNVRYKLLTTTIWIETIISNNTTEAIAFLSPSTQYIFQVQAVCAVPGTYSVGYIFATPIACGTPGSLSATNITSSSATLNWGAVSGATIYNIRYRRTGTTTWTNTFSFNTPKAVTALLASTQYEFQVQALCSETGSFSASRLFTTTLPCATPGSLFANSITSGSATLNWVASGAISYDIQYRPINSLTWITTTSSTTSKAVTGLLASTQYEFQVRARCSGGGISNYSSSSIFTTTAGGGGPTRLSAPEGLGLDVVLYPNPVSSVLNVDYNITKDNSSVLINIYDMKGELLTTKQYENVGLGNHTYTLDLNSEASISSMANGIFLCMVNINGRMETKRFMMMK